MKITRVETLEADAGWRMFSFLKVSTSDGIVGWSEFNESFGSTGLSDVIKGLTPVLVGRDPRRFEQVTQHLPVLTRQSRGNRLLRRSRTPCSISQGRHTVCLGRAVWRSDPRTNPGLLVAFWHLSRG